MEARHLILMIIDACGNKIESKTKIQKIAYFFSIKNNENYQYNPYYYGPYSRIIEEGLSELTGAGFVEVNTCSFRAEDDKGFEKKRYDYAVTNSGKELLDYLKSAHKKDYDKIYEISNKLKDANYLDLSIAAKSYYILRETEQNITHEQISEKAGKFGWEIYRNDISSAIGILKNLEIL